MTAEELLSRYGTELVGTTIMTEAFGDYPGGPAKVIELCPDPEAPEIVLQVKHPTFGEIGVFDFEEVALLAAPAQ